MPCVIILRCPLIIERFYKPVPYVLDHIGSVLSLNRRDYRPCNKSSDMPHVNGETCLELESIGSISLSFWLTIC